MLALGVRVRLGSSAMQAARRKLLQLSILDYPGLPDKQVPSGRILPGPGHPFPERPIPDLLRRAQGGWDTQAVLTGRALPARTGGPSGSAVRPQQSLGRGQPFLRSGIA